MSKKKKKSEQNASAIAPSLQQEQPAGGGGDELSQPQSSSRQPLNYGRFVQKLQQTQGSSNNLSSNDPQRSQIIDSQRSEDVSASKQPGSSAEVPLQQNSIPRDAGQLSQRGGKPAGSLKHVKLPSLNRLDMDQYQSLKQLLKQGCRELNAAGKLNMKYFRQSGNVESAEYFAANKQYEKALGLYEQVMNQEPGNIKIVLEKSDCLRLKGDYDSAIEHYDYASSLDPPPKTQVRILFNKATALKCQQKLADAIEFYSQSSLLDPNNSNTFFNKGLTQYQAGKIDEAIVSFSQALKINPKDSEALLNKGSALREVGEFGQAVECFKQASEIKPKTARDFLNRGNALFQIDKLQESLNCFIKAAELDDGLAEAHLNKGVVLFELGRTQEELQCYDKVLQAKPNDIKALYNRGLALREKGDIPGSLSAFNAVLQIDNSMIDALINKGIIYYVTGRYNESIKTYKEALVLDKNSLIANINLGLCWRALNQSKRALSIYLDALKVHPQSSEMHFSIGEIFRESLNLREALGSYAKAIEFNPIYSEAIFQKGVCLLIANEIGPAASCFNLCLQFDPADPKHLMAKGQIFEIEGKIKAAIAKYDEANKSSKKELDSESAASLLKSHALSLKRGLLCKKSAVDSYLQIILNSHEKHSLRQYAQKGICGIVVDEVLAASKQALLKASGMNITSKLPGSEIDDVYCHLLCILSSQIELMTTFTSSELRKIQEDYCSEQSQNLIFRYLTLKRKSGANNLSMESGQHIIYMVLSFIYLALKKRENKEFEEAIIFFDFLMHLDKDLELFCRYHCFISFLQGSAFSASIKKFSIPLTRLVRKGKNMELHEIQFEKEPLPSEDQKHTNSVGASSQQSSRQELASQQQQQQPAVPLPSSCINRIFLERYEKELICRKIPFQQFKDKKDEYYSSFALQNILNHRNIQKINYLYLDTEENGYFIEPLQKQDLRQFLNQNIVTLEQRLNVLIQLSNAVAYLHSNRVLHGSIESKNILLKETDNSVVLTNFTKSKPLVKSYHHSFTLDPSPINHLQSYYSASQQISPTSFFAVETDIKIALSDDIKSLGELFQSLLLKISQADRLVNNWHRKGFSVSAQLQKTILRMVDDKKTKRPDIQTVMESLQLEIISALLYSSLSAGVSMPPQTNKLSSQGTNSKTNLLNTAQRSSFINPSSSNLSALSLHQQQILQQSAIMSDPISVQDSEDPSQVKKIEDINSPGIKGKTAKKNLQYFQFAQDIESIRDFYKMKIIYQSSSSQSSSLEVQSQVNEKISNNLRLSYQYLEDLTNSELFLSSLNKSNMIILVIAIYGITDCGNYEQLQLIKRFNEAVEMQSKKFETDNILQFSQARLFYRVTNRNDPEKYRQKLLQKTHFKEFYMNISSIFLSDSIELIENKLRPIFIESLTKHAFQQVKRNLNGFTFAPSISIKKRKFLIFEQFVQVASQLILPSSEIDKIAKDLIVHSKILNILKFEGYLQDLGEGVYDLLFNPLSEIIDKYFSFCKTDTCAITDLPQTAIIPAKQFYSQKIKYAKEIYKGVDAMKEYAVNYTKKQSIKRGSYVLDMKRSTLVSLEHADSAKKPTQAPISDSQRKSSVGISLQVPPSSSTNRQSQRLSQRFTGQQGENDQEKAATAGSIKTTSNSLTNRDGKDEKSMLQQQGISQNQHYKSNSSSQSPISSPVSLFQVASPYQSPPILTLSQESSKIKQGSSNKLKEPVILFQEASFTNYQTKNLTEIILEETNTHFAQLRALASEQKLNEAGQKDTNASSDKKKTVILDKSQNNPSKMISAMNSTANIQQESIISSSNLSVHGEESNRETGKKTTGKSNRDQSNISHSISSAQGLNASSIQQQQEQLIQAQNAAISSSQAMVDFIEEESYQQFIQNYLKNCLLANDNNLPSGSSVSATPKHNASMSGIQNQHKLNSSLNHIPSEEEGDEEEDVKTTGKKSKEGSKQETPGQTVKSSARDSQLIKPAEKKEIDEKNKPAKQATKMSLNMEGVERKMSIVQGVAKIKAVKSVIGVSDSLSSTQNIQQDDYQELRANFAISNGSLNEQKQILIQKILKIDFGELKELFENLKKQQQQAEQ